jgi:hypothetical protein
MLAYSRVARVAAGAVFAMRGAEAGALVQIAFGEELLDGQADRDPRYGELLLYLAFRGSRCRLDIRHRVYRTLLYP